MTVEYTAWQRRVVFVIGAAVLLAGISMPAQQMVTETRDPAQIQDEDFAKAVKEWTTQPYYMSPLVDHLPKVQGIPTPKDVLGYHVGAPAKLTYYADALKYYRALAAATPRVKIETIGTSDEDRELVVVWVSSDDNIKNLQQNRDNLAKIADPRGLSETQISQLVATTKPHYHLMGGLHSGETGPSEMLMELVYRLATETSPLIKQIRENVIVSVTPQADPDGRDRNVDWFNRTNDQQSAAAAGGGTAAGAGTGAGGGSGAAPAQAGGGRGTTAVPYWGKYVYHDNNRDINLSQKSMRAIVDWYFTAHPPIMHDLHESLTLLYTYSGAAPQNPNLDPILFTELPFFSNFELSQMTKWGMPGVYTHAFMDGWSPGYLGSVAYNHNGMMRMYETQSGRESGPGPGAAAGRGGEATAEGAARGAGAGRGEGTAEGRGDGRAAAAGRGARGEGRGEAAPMPAMLAVRRCWPCRRHSANRPWWRSNPRVVPRPPGAAERCQHVLAAQQHELHADSRVERASAHRVLSQPRRRQLLPQDEELDRGGQDRSAVRLRHPRAARHDARGRPRQHPARAADRDRPGVDRDQGQRWDVPRGLVRDQARSACTAGSRRTSSRGRASRIRTSEPTTTAAGRWVWRC